jgi:hypothetical protein
MEQRILHNVKESRLRKGKQNKIFGRHKLNVTVSTRLNFILNFQVHFEIGKMVNYMCLSLCNEVCIRNSNAF